MKIAAVRLGTAWDNALWFVLDKKDDSNLSEEQFIEKLSEWFMEELGIKWTVKEGRSFLHFKSDSEMTAFLLRWA